MIIKRFTMRSNEGWISQSCSVAKVSAVRADTTRFHYNACRVRKNKLSYEIARGIAETTRNEGILNNSGSDRSEWRHDSIQSVDCSGWATMRNPIRSAAAAAAVAVAENFSFPWMYSFTHSARNRENTDEEKIWANRGTLQKYVILSKRV